MLPVCYDSHTPIAVTRAVPAMRPIPAMRPRHGLAMSPEARSRRPNPAERREAERVALRGLGALPDDGLLALVLEGGRARPAGRERARCLLAARRLEAWATLAPAACTTAAAEALPGGAEATGRCLAALFELARRALGPPPGVELARPEDVAAHCTSFRSARREHFVGFYLNARNQLLTRALVSVGSLSASIVHPREVFEPAITGGAAGLIVAHNHPSGDPEPSPEDVAVTRRLAQAGELLGIELLDHVVVADRGFVSLKLRGYL